MHAARVAIAGTAAPGQFDGVSSTGVFLGRPLLSSGGVVVVLLVLALAATGAGLLFRRNARADVERWLWLAGCAPAAGLRWDATSWARAALVTATGQQSGCCGPAVQDS